MTGPVLMLRVRWIMNFIMFTSSSRWFDILNGGKRPRDRQMDEPLHQNRCNWKAMLIQVQFGLFYQKIVWDDTRIEGYIIYEHVYSTGPRKPGSAYNVALRTSIWLTSASTDVEQPRLPYSLCSCDWMAGQLRHSERAQCSQTFI